MIVKTLFNIDGRLEPGEVEVKLLPGIPQLHFVGLADASIKECGLKLKAALRSSGLKWPVGQQIVISLRPMDSRKSGAGVDLAVALAYLKLTRQLPGALAARLDECVVYGELALNGEVIAPADVNQALRLIGARHLITGRLQSEVRDGEWYELAHLTASELLLRRREFPYDQHWRRPEVPEDLYLHKAAVRALILAAHLKLSVLVAGPQGSGKTTWAKLLHSLLPPPDLFEMKELAVMFGEEVFESRWRPFEQPHHSATVQAMIGGGLPIQPGVVSRAHGGLLVMDEFLEFHPQVLESMREPLESGSVTLARKGRREKLNAGFQLVGTTNLCPCGRLSPEEGIRCGFALGRCRSVVQRLSGPLLDRFELLVMSHEWLKGPRLFSMADVQEKLEAVRGFALERPSYLAADEVENSRYLCEGLSHRRERALLRVARGLADLDFSHRITGLHRQEAFKLTVEPMHRLREIFA